jgi:Rifampin ADP-ribosyl transferase
MADDVPTTESASATTRRELRGPFFHGTRVALQVGDELVPGRVSNFHHARVMNNIYFTALLETAAWERSSLRPWLASTSAVTSTRWCPRDPSRTTPTSPTRSSQAIGVDALDLGPVSGGRVHGTRLLMRASTRPRISSRMGRTASMP